MRLLTSLLASPYASARSLYSLLEVGSINSLFLGCPAPLVGMPVWGQVAQEDSWQGWKGHRLFSCSWGMQERWGGLTHRT